MTTTIVRHQGGAMGTRSESSVVADIDPENWRHDMYAIVSVTPDLAAEWLEGSAHNRPVSRARVNQLARDMSLGKWVITNQGIGFDTYGSLIDGQHRLHAVLQSGVTVKMLVIRGLSRDAQANIDTGKARTPGDMLALDGFRDATMLAGIGRLKLGWDNGTRSVSQYKATHAEIREFVVGYEHPELLARAVEVTRMARRPGFGKLARPALIGFAYLVCAEIDRDDAEEFFVAKLLNRVGMREMDPVMALHRRLSFEANHRGSSGDFQKIAYLFCAWRKHRKGERLSKLQAPHGGWTTENMWLPR